MKNKDLPWDAIIHSLSGSLSEERKKELDCWIAKTGNKDVYAGFQSLFFAIQSKVASYTPDREYYWNELSKRLDFKNKKDLKSAEKTISYRKVYRYAAVACITTLVALYSTFFLGQQTVYNKADMLTYSTFGGKSKIQLPDGTVVWLHGLASISYPSIFTGQSRKVHLSGEAFFEVTKDPSKPFIIDVLEEIEVEVLGTQFNIEAKPEASNITVSLNEGAVALNVNEQRFFMKRDDQAIYNKHTQQVEVTSKANVHLQSLWKSSQLHFVDEPLGSVVRKLCKWYGVSIEVDSLLMSEYSYTFTLRHESLEEVLRIMNKINPMEYTFIEPTEVTIKQYQKKKN